MRVLIVESPSKCKTIKQILGDGWMVRASYGHITELDKTGVQRMGVEVDYVNQRVKCDYKVKEPEQLKRLQSAIAGAQQVYLATDKDREGEAIAWHLARLLNLKHPLRVVYGEITPTAIQQAIAQPTQINLNLVSAQRARQCLDRIMGWHLSELSRQIGAKSAGRVQSAVLNLICQREQEIEQFVPQNYWVLTADYGILLASAQRYDNLAQATADRERAFRSKHFVAKVETTDQVKPPPLPFKTSTLQQCASSELGFPPELTMALAQELFEGVELGDHGTKALITYHRTESQCLSQDFLSSAKRWLKQTYPQLVGEPKFQPNQFPHEAIRPTYVEITPQSIKHLLKEQHYALYDLIWRRTTAHLCIPAIIAKTEIIIDGGITWKANGRQLKQQGYTVFWHDLEKDVALPNLSIGQELNLSQITITERQTEPPPRFTEAKLVAEMEQQGIGRPSTFAHTIHILKERNYVTLKNKVIHPTNLGKELIKFLGNLSNDLISVEFTARLEEQLDRISENQLNWEQFICQWYVDSFMPIVNRAQGVSGYPCPQCGKELRKRFYTKGLERKEMLYCVDCTNVAFFYTQSGKFWSPQWGCLDVSADS